MSELEPLNLQKFKILQKRALRSLRPPESKSIHYWLTVTLEGIMVVGLVLSVFKGQWLNTSIIVGILFLTLLPTLLGKKFDVYIPPVFQFMAILLIFASLFLGEIHHYYTRFWWWDIVLHAGSSFLLGILGFLLVYILNQDERIQMHMEIEFVALFAFAFTTAIGVIWEIFEFGVDVFFGYNMQKSGLVDTMGDLIVNTLSALAISTAGYSYFKSEKTYFLEEWIAKFIEGNPRLFRKNGRIREAPKPLKSPK